MKKFISLLALIFSFSAGAIDLGEQADGYFNAGLNLGISTEAALKDVSWELQYGKMLSENRSLALGLITIGRFEDAGLGFQGNYEHNFSTKGKLTHGVEAFLSLGIDKDFERNKDEEDESEEEDEDKASRFGIGFGGGGFVKMPVSKKITTIFKYGIALPIQALGDIEISADTISLYIGMDFRYHLY